MIAESWLYLIIGLVIFNYLFNTVLNFVNDKNWKSEIPDSMKDFYEKEKYLKAKAYSKEKGAIGFISSTISLLITVSLLYFEGYGWLSNLIANHYNIPFLQSALFFL